MGSAWSWLPELYTRHGKEAVDLQLAALLKHGNVIDDPRLWLEAALAHDFKFMPVEVVSRCACGSRATRSLGRFLFWNLLGVRECARCGMLFVSPRLTRDAINSIFSDAYFENVDLEWWGARRARIFADVMRVLEAHGVRSVFDVGAAYGHFVAYARARGLIAEGSDISQKAADIARTRLGVSLHVGDLSTLSLPPGTMDAVVSLDTLYYVADPSVELSTMRKLVRPGGVLVLRLRNAIWSRAIARFGRVRKIGPPPFPAPHLWGFTPRSISVLLEETGWSLESCEPAAYSETVLGGLQLCALAINRAARRAWRRAPILTRSFNVVARSRS